MTLSLPIPGKKEKLAFFYIPYNISKDYVNHKGEVYLRDSDSVRSFREAMAQKFGLDQNSYLVTTV